jgi:UV DNA damage endonuclease
MLKRRKTEDRRENQITFPYLSGLIIKTTSTMRLGYACINLTLAEKNVKVNRSMMKRSFLTKGIDYASELALANIEDLEKIIDWNIDNEIYLYRMSSDMFPWMSEYELSDLPHFDDIKTILARSGQKATKNNLRLTFHPGPFNVLASQNIKVISNTEKELRQHGEITDLMGLPVSPYSKINIHVGGAYGDKIAALDRFAASYEKLPDTARKRLTVENDDKANLYSVKDLMWLHKQTHIPIVFDYFHHLFCTGGWQEGEALAAALSTWPEDIKPVVHFSSPKRIFEDGAAMATSHADYLYEMLDHYGRDIDIMLEAKAKEYALIKYKKEFDIFR